MQLSRAAFLSSAASALKLTTAAYIRPNGHNIHRFPDSKETDEWGVMPDKGFELKLGDSELGELVRVREPVSTVLEMTEIQTRLLAEQGPAVLFENVVRKDGSRSDMPVLVNLFGTVERVAWGMDREPAQLRAVGETLAFLKQPEPPGGWREAMAMLPMLKAAMAMKPKTTGKAPCQEVVLTGNDIDLSMLPIQTCWPGEPAPLITWPLVVTKGPGDGREDNFNLGIYRMQVTDESDYGVLKLQMPDGYHFDTLRGFYYALQSLTVDVAVGERGDARQDSQRFHAGIVAVRLRPARSADPWTWTATARSTCGTRSPAWCGPDCTIP